MKNSYCFFSNKECKYFPCHNGLEEFNCLFCYCPLYFIKDCGGNFKILDNGVKDCSDCIIPHTPGGYKIILEKLAKYSKYCGTL